VPFSGFKLHADLLKGIRELGFTRPTPIQMDAIPPGVEGRDILACAMTGSGKTVAFLIPILNQLINVPRRTTRALILTPTRELAAQILEDLNDLAVHTPITGAAVFGGVGMGPQEHAFRSGVDVIIATPGRLLDHFDYPYAKMRGLEILVLDEADRMLDMGFLPDIKRVLKHIPTRRQTLFFSATMPDPIANLAHQMLKNPAVINQERKSAPAVGVTQAVYPVPQELKSSLLVALLESGLLNDALVFTRTKHRADRVADFLVRAGIAAERIHGNRSQSQRTLALAGFKSGKHRVLVATDIAARGIDVEALGHVINFDVPNVPEDYIHRVGRTARAQMTGDAFTFVSPAEEGDMMRIEKMIGRRLPRITVPDFDYRAAPPRRLELSNTERRAQSRDRRTGPGGGSGRGKSGPRRPSSGGGGGGRGRPASKPGSEGSRPSSPSSSSSRKPRRSRRQGRSW
jgi:ATP-dependent RNA helicase RhlE